MGHKFHLIGGGGLAKDVIACFAPHVSLTGIWDDQLPIGTSVWGVPVLGKINDIHTQPDEKVVITVGNPSLRKKLFEQFESSLAFENLIHPSVTLYQMGAIQMGKGNILMPMVYCTLDITIQHNCLFHIGSGIHHDAQVQSHVVLMPGAKITCGALLAEGTRVAPNVCISQPIETLPFSNIV